MARDIIRIRPGDVTLYPGEPWLYITDLNGPVMRDLERRMGIVQTVSRRKVGVRTGALLSTIRKNSGRRATYPYVDVIAGRRGMRYVMAHHDGTAPHVIRARRRKALRFTVGGRVVIRTKVMHPGTRGTRFLTAALPFAAG
jgi:hypothetical protein